jgi:hypothetical protein
MLKKNYKQLDEVSFLFRNYSAKYRFITFSKFSKVV